MSNIELLKILFFIIFFPLLTSCFMFSRFVNCSFINSCFTISVIDAFRSAKSSVSILISLSKLDFSVSVIFISPSLNNFISKYVFIIILSYNNLFLQNKLITSLATKLYILSERAIIKDFKSSLSLLFIKILIRSIFL